MFKTVEFSGYYIKGKLVQPMSTTGEGLERDHELEKYESAMAIELTKMILEKKPAKKKVYFVEIEAQWLETGSFKKVETFVFNEMACTPKEFWKTDKDAAKYDAKELAREVKDEVYE